MRVRGGAEQPRHPVGFEAAAEQKAHFPSMAARLFEFFLLVSLLQSSRSEHVDYG